MSANWKFKIHSHFELTCCKRSFATSVNIFDSDQMKISSVTEICRFVVLEDLDDF